MSHRSTHEDGELSGRFISPTSKEAARLSQRAGAPSHQWSRPVIGKIGPASPGKKRKKPVASVDKGEQGGSLPRTITIIAMLKEKSP